MENWIKLEAPNYGQFEGYETVIKMDDVGNIIIVQGFARNLIDTIIITQDEFILIYKNVLNENKKRRLAKAKI